MAPAKSNRSPAFQFYPKDFMTSAKVLRMTNTEVGIYIKLLSVCWLNGGLPTSTDALARIAGVPPKQFARIWPNVLVECFVERSGRLVNERLEKERRAQREFRERQRTNAAKRWHERGNAVAMPPQCQTDALLSPISDLQSANKKEVDSTPVILTFPVSGGSKEWGLTQGQIDAWRASFPGLDVEAECRKALAWTTASPAKKTANGMPRFLVNWLSRATNNSKPVVNSKRPSWAV